MVLWNFELNQGRSKPLLLRFLSVWTDGSLVSARGTPSLQFTTAAPALVRTRDVTITNTQYLAGGGGALGLVF